MITSFCLDPDAIALSDLKEESFKLGIYDMLFSIWDRYGVLTLPEASLQESELYAAVMQLPLRFRKRWEEALETLRVNAVSGNSILSELLSNPDGVAVLAQHVALAGVDPVRAALLGVPDGEYKGQISGLEVCYLHFIDRSETLRPLVEQGGLQLPGGTPTADIWSRLFRRLASHSKQVKIVDRYCCERHLKRRDGRSGLRNFGAMLNACGRSFALGIYASYDECDRQDIIDEVKGLFAGFANIKSLWLHLSPDEDFRRVCHQRHIRFDRSSLEIDVGLEVMEGESSYREASVSLRNDVIDRRRIEKNIGDLSPGIKLK